MNDYFGGIPLKIINKSNFQCQGCGNCCKYRGDVFLLPMDIFQISRFLKMEIADFIENYTDKIWTDGKWDLAIKDQQDDENTCIFHQENGCEIHPVKPTACYWFPFLPYGRKFVCQQIPCTTKKHMIKEALEVKDIIEQSSNGRYSAQKELTEQVIKTLYYVECKNLSKTSKEAEQIFELFFLEYDLNGNMEKQIKTRLSSIENM